jgi:hypothetical protein
MEEQKSSAGSWLRNIASVFVELKPEEKEVGSQPATPSVSSTNFVGNSSPSTPAYSASVSNEFVEDLRGRFKKLLDEKNQAGFDFYEFSLMLLRTNPNPSVEHFKTAYEGAKLLNQSCSQQFLLDSANFYKKELQTAFDSTVSAGQQKKGAIDSEKATEQKQLNADIASIEQQLTQLRQQIVNLEKTQAEKIESLRGIDTKFSAKFGEIEQKMTATVTAKDSVLNEIVLIENGIKQYLK